MEPLLYILMNMFVTFAASVFFLWVYGQSKSEKEEDGYLTKTKNPFRLALGAVILSSIVVLMFLVGTVLLCFEEDFPLHSWIAFESVSVVFILLSLLLVLMAFSVHEIIYTDGILIVRVFKKRFVKYSQIISYYYSPEINELTVFGDDRKVLFTVSDNRVGMKTLLDQLESKDVLREYMREL